MAGMAAMTVITGTGIPTNGATGMMDMITAQADFLKTGARDSMAAGIRHTTPSP